MPSQQNLIIKYNTNGATKLLGGTRLVVVVEWWVAVEKRTGAAGTPGRVV